MNIAKYGRRFWAVYDEQGLLLCVCLYLKGAREVLRRLSSPLQITGQLNVESLLQSLEADTLLAEADEARVCADPTLCYEIHAIARKRAKDLRTTLTTLRLFLHKQECLALAEARAAVIAAEVAAALPVL